MKNKTKVMIGLAVASLATLALAACSGSTNRYGQYEKDGYGIRVRYYSNGGQFASTADVDLVDVYKLPESGGIRLIEPGSDERGPKGEKTQIAYTGHFLAGWYQTRTEITDVNGEKTYSYSDPWDFKNDRLTVDKDKTFEEDEAALSLYAVWVPNFTYTFYAQSGADRVQKPAVLGLADHALFEKKTYQMIINPQELAKEDMEMKIEKRAGGRHEQSR